MSTQLIFTVLLINALAFFGCTKKETIDHRTIPEEPVMGSFLVELENRKENLSQPADFLGRILTEFLDRNQCSISVEKVLWENGGQVLSTELLNTFHMALQDCQLDKQDLEEVLGLVAVAPGIRNIEANAIAKSLASENDVFKNRQYYLQSIKRDEACEASDIQGPPVVVAIVDSGVQRDHPELVDSFLRDDQGNVIGANFVGKGSRGLPDDQWDDRQGHGTHVAGIIAAKPNNSTGIVGVASCKNVKIMPIRVMDENGYGKSLEIDRGIQWAAAMGADIINLSLGNRSIARSEKYVHSKTLYESLNKRGVIVFAAAGNDGEKNGQLEDDGYVYSYPASYDHVISVSATDRNSELAKFSVSGERVDIAAPGEGILSTFIGSDYKYLDGTSMAVPIAAGSYAIALSSIRESGSEILYHDTVLDILIKSSIPSPGITQNQIEAAGTVDSLRLTESITTWFSESSASAANDIPAEMEPITEAPPTPPQPPANEEENPEDPSPDPTPVMEPQGMRFVGLQNEGVVSGPIKITVTGWPAYTSRVRLYWITGSEWFPKSFTSLGRDNLDTDGVNLTTQTSYVLYGKRYLVAEAIDPSGFPIEMKRIVLTGNN